jgi:hypothetical protein
MYLRRCLVLKNKKFNTKENSKIESMIDHDNNSRNSVHGYMEMGNDAQVHAKARALRNNDNSGSDI